MKRPLLNQILLSIIGLVLTSIFIPFGLILHLLGAENVWGKFYECMMSIIWD